MAFLYTGVTLKRAIWKLSRGIDFFRDLHLFTTNKSLSEWGKVLHDEDLAATVSDPVLECGRFIQLDRPSGRTPHLDLEDVWPATAERFRIPGINGAKFPGRTLVIAWDV
jgi:hypothetical protein